MFSEIKEMMERIERLENALNRTFSLGKVKEIDEKTARVRVLLEEHNVLTYWLPVLVRKTEMDKEYWMPDLEELVLCIFTPPAFERGFVLGSPYTFEDSPPIQDRDKWIKRFKDGTILQYDRKAHKLFIDVQGEAYIRTTGQTTVQADKTIKLDGGSADISGVVTKKCICPFTGKPHSDYSKNVFSSKG